MFSQQESDQQQNTCVFLQQQNEHLQQDCDQRDQHVESLKV